MVLFPGCSCCGGDPCCPTGKLPDTVTVTFTGPQGAKSQGPGLLDVSFSACYGSGAKATAAAPGGERGVDVGPVSSVTMSDHGSGYAKLGRAEAVLTFPDATAGAIIALTKKQDACQIDYWSVDSITLAQEWAYYTDGDQVTLDAGEGDTVETPLHAFIRDVRIAPTLTASVGGGAGAEFGKVSISPNGDDPPTWRVVAVPVVDGGAGYTHGDQVTFDGSRVEVAEAAIASIETEHEAPSADIGVPPGAPGTGAEMTAVFTENVGDGTWSVVDAVITNGGTGYAPGYPVVLENLDGVGEGFGGAIASVDANGAITAIGVYYGGGSYFKDTGVIKQVTVGYGGKYCRLTPGVTIYDGGKYYHEDTSLPPYVAEVTATLNQAWPSQGTGAVLTANVEEDTSSAAFGTITSVDVADGGDDYLGWRWIFSCDCEWVKGKEAGADYSITAYRNKDLEAGTESCTYTGFRCWSYDGTPPGTVLLGPLVAVEISSGLKGPLRPALRDGVSLGVPGRDNGPIFEINFGDDPSCYKCFQGWAYAGRKGVTPTELYPGGTAATCSMQQRMNGLFPYWTLSSVSVSDNTRTEPTVSATASPGSAAFSVSLSSSNNAWEVASVAVANGGSGYADTAVVTFAAGPTDIVNRPATATAWTRRDKPGLLATVQGGSGAKLTVSLQKQQDGSGRDVWAVSSVNIEDGGAEYTVNQPVNISTTDGTQAGAIAAKVATIGYGGSIASIAIASNTATFYKNSGVIESVHVTDGGEYFRPKYYNGQPVSIWYPVAECDESGGPSEYNASFCLDTISFGASGPVLWYEFAPDHDQRRFPQGLCVVNANGELTGITITDEGYLYRQVHSDEEPPIAPEVTATIIQTPPSEGRGATVKASIKTDTRSRNFGDLSLTIDQHGDGYLLYAAGASPVNVADGNSATPPSVDVLCPGFLIQYTADGPLEDCSDPSFIAMFEDSTISVAADESPPTYWGERSEPSPPTATIKGHGPSVLPSLPVNAVLSTAITASGNVWGVGSVSVTDGGNGYDESSSIPVTFTAGKGDKQRRPAVATAATKRIAPPSLDVTLEAFGVVGASVKATLSQQQDENGKPYWSVDADSITIENGGVILYVYPTWPVYLSGPSVWFWKSGRFVANGIIGGSFGVNKLVGINVTENTARFYDNAIDTVTVADPGEYFRPSVPFNGRNRCCGRCDTNCFDTPTQVVLYIHKSPSSGHNGLGVIDCPEDEHEVIIDVEKTIEDCTDIHNHDLATFAVSASYESVTINVAVNLVTQSTSYIVPADAAISVVVSRHWESSLWNYDWTHPLADREYAKWATRSTPSGTQKCIDVNWNGGREDQVVYENGGVAVGDQFFTDQSGRPPATWAVPITRICNDYDDVEITIQ